MKDKKIKKKIFFLKDFVDFGRMYMFRYDMDR